MKWPFKICSLIALLSAGCSETNSQPGNALPISNQDSSAIVPGNGPLENRMGTEGTQHYRRKVITP